MLLQNNLASLSNEMGRRKLPSLPSAPISSGTLVSSINTSTATQDLNKYSCKLDYKAAPLKTLAEISYNAGSAISPLVTGSSRTLPLFYREFGSAAQARFIIPKGTSTSNNLSQSSSSTSLLYNNLLYPVDPAIIPGEIFKVDSIKNVKISRPAIMSNAASTTSLLYGNKNSGTQLSKASMETLSHLKYKKELREALNIRRQTLEACEIEANHRQYTINRMLNSGLMPSHRSIEIESIPNVTKCTLPSELIKNVKIVFNNNKLNALPTKNESDLYSFGTKQFVSKYDSQSYLQQQPKMNLKKSVACQFNSCLVNNNNNEEAPSTQILYSLPLTSLRYQLKENQQQKRDSETQTDKTSQTQTDFNVQVFTEMDGNLLFKSAKNLPSIKPNKNYDQRLRKCIKKFDKPRFEFTDIQNISDIENKRREILYELNQRRNKISSMIDLRYLQEEPLIKYPTRFSINSSDYASIVPHYGSLPLIDYPTAATTTAKSRKLYSNAKNRYRNYGSLPRNYERYMSDSKGNELLMNSHLMDGSTSLYNLNQLNNYNSNGYSFPTRSLNYLNASNYSPQIYNSNKQQQQQLPYGVDTTAPPTDYYGGNMLSQFANYLNNQFLLNQQDNVDLNAPQFQQQSQQQIINDRLNAIPSTSIYMSNSEEIPLPQLDYSLNQLWNNPTQPRNFSHVYSRNENNYGKRPFKYPPGDYGNYLHNRAQNLSQLDNLQNFINHNRFNNEMDYYPNPTWNYSPRFQQQKEQRYYSNEQPEIIDGLNRVMQQYSRNSTANLQRPPPFQVTPLMYGQNLTTGRQQQLPYNSSIKGVDEIDYSILKSFPFIDGR